MTTLVVTVDDEAASKARQVALRKETSLESMLSGYIVSLGRDEPEANRPPERHAAAEQLMRSFNDLSRPLGGKGYVSRDELYDR